MHIRFSISTLFIKITSRQFWVWGITTIIVRELLLLDGEHSWFMPLIIVWGVVSILYLGGSVLIDALSKMIEKASLNITQNNNINTDTKITGTIGVNK